MYIYIYIIALFHQHVFFSGRLPKNQDENPPNPPWLSATYYDPIRLEKHLDLGGCGWMHVIFGHIGSFFEVGHIMAYQPWIVAFNFCAENEDSPGNCEALSIGTYGGFLKWRYPKSSMLIGVSIINKPSILGYHYFRKPPYDIWIIRGLPLSIWDTIMAAVSRTPRGPTKDRCFPFLSEATFGSSVTSIGILKDDKVYK